MPHILPWLAAIMLLAAGSRAQANPDQWRAGAATALGDPDIAKGRDVGSVEVTGSDGAALVHA